MPPPGAGDASAHLGGRGVPNHCQQLAPTCHPSLGFHLANPRSSLFLSSFPFLSFDSVSQMTEAAGTALPWRSLGTCAGGLGACHKPGAVLATPWLLHDNKPPHFIYLFFCSFVSPRPGTEGLKAMAPKPLLKWADGTSRGI